MHELNLLPPYRRRSLRHQATIVSLRHFFDSVLMGAGTLTAVGVATWVMLWFAASATSSGSAEELLQAVQDYQVLRDDIAEQNLFLSDIHGTGATRIVWSEWLVDFFERVPPGVDISQFSGQITAGEEGAQTVNATFSGGALSSRTLDTFTRELRGIPTVASVDAPLSNLLNPSAYSFTLTFKSDGQSE